MGHLTKCSRFIVAITAAQFLIACATFQKAIPANSVESVIIAPDLPDTLFLDYVGTFVFQNTSAVEPADFGLNEFIRAELASALKTKYKIVELEIGHVAPEKAASDEEQMAKIGPRLREVVQPGKADAIVVAAGRLGRGPYWFTAPRSAQFSKAGVSWVLLVFDGKTFDVLGYSIIGDGRKFQPMTQGWNGQPYGPMSSAVKDTLAKAFKADIADSLPTKLREVGLTP